MNETATPLNHMMLNLRKGVEFEGDSGGDYLLKEWNGGKIWIFYKHPDGQWVSLREATQHDINRVAKKLSPRRG